MATDISGSRDIVEDGVSGILVPPEDHEALARALQRIATSPGLRQQLGDASRQWILARVGVLASRVWVGDRGGAMAGWVGFCCGGKRAWTVAVRGLVGRLDGVRRHEGGGARC